MSADIKFPRTDYSFFSGVTAKYQVIDRFFFSALFILVDSIYKLIL